MKKSEHRVAIKKAEAELLRLQSIVPEPEEVPCVLPERRDKEGTYWFLASTGQPHRTCEEMYEADTVHFKTGNYFSSQEQAEGWQDAIKTLRLMRRQDGIIDPTDSTVDAMDILYVSSKDRVAVMYQVVSDPDLIINLSNLMSPAFKVGKTKAAIANVGEDRILRAAKWLAGVQ